MRIVDNVICNLLDHLKRKIIYEIVDNLRLERFIPRMSSHPVSAERPRVPTAAEITEWIRERIRRGRFVPGQRLVEVDIIRGTGGSRSKVREALQRLEGEGLVTIEEFCGASVRSASIEEVRQIYRARVALEGLSAGDFTRHASADDRRRLRELHDELEACVAGGAPERFGRLNTEWHQRIVAGSGNAVIADVLQRLNVPVHRLVFESFYNAERLRTAIADHRVILAAVEAGDAEGAEMAMRRHIEDGFEMLSHIDHEVNG